MSKTAVPEEAGLGTRWGENAMLAGEETEGLALPLRNKTDDRPQNPISSGSQGVLASAQEDTACLPPTGEGGSEGQAIQKPSKEAGNAYTGGRVRTEMICILHFWFQLTRSQANLTLLCH